MDENNSKDGDEDVDGGRTTLMSPTFDLSAVPDPSIGYWRFYKYYDQYQTTVDFLAVDISADGGVTWTNVETLHGQEDSISRKWVHHEFRVADYIAPTAQVRVRFVAADIEENSLLEAAIDDFTVTTPVCVP